jgi:hypothetical protein
MNRTQLLYFELTYEERATWGECPTCGVSHGEKCLQELGIELGRNVDGKRPNDGVHLGRLQRAPFCVRIVPA